METATTAVTEKRTGTPALVGMVAAILANFTDHGSKLFADRVSFAIILLSSVAPISHWFTYHFGKTIPIIGTNPDNWPADANYVCFYLNNPPLESERCHIEILDEVIVDKDEPIPLTIVVAKRLDNRIAENIIDERRTHE